MIIFVFAEQLDVSCFKYGLPALTPLLIAFLLFLDSAGLATSVMALTAGLTALMAVWVIVYINICISAISFNFFLNFASKYLLDYFLYVKSVLMRLVFAFDTM